MARSSLYGAYLFRDKDPEIDKIRTVIQRELGNVSRKNLATIEHNGGPVAATLDNWFNGATRRPQNSSLEAAGRAIGWHREWSKMSQAEYAIVLKQATRVAEQKAAERKKKARKQNGRKKR